MQSNKASKKTKAVEESANVLAPESAKTETAAKPRATRSSKSKKAEPEIGSAKHHHKVITQPIAETAEIVVAPLTMTTAAGAGAVRSPSIDGAGFVTTASPVSVSAASAEAPVAVESKLSPTTTESKPA